MFDFESLHVLVIGDLMLDQYIMGDVSRISPEAPVPIIDQKSRETRLGGAANVAANLISLGAQTTLLGVAGDDIEHQTMLSRINEVNISAHLIKDTTRPTTLKTRLIANHQQILRVDKEANHDISDNIADNLINKVDEILANESIDFVIIQDYNKGVLTPYSIPRILATCRRHHVRVGIDPKINNIESYKGATFIKPNLREALAMLNVSKETFFNKTETLARQLLEWLEMDEVWITLGEHGVCGINKDSQYITLPTTVSQVIDVCGAGDAVICILSLMTCQDANLRTKAAAMNVVGSIVCTQPGVVTVQSAEVQTAWNNREKTKT